MSDYKLHEDVEMSLEEQDRALDMVNRGEITIDDFEWLAGGFDPADEPELLKAMEAKQRRRWFAIQNSVNRRAGVTPRKRRKKAA
jgi:hypothetical protein